MKSFSKFSHYLGGFVLLFCLFVGLSLTSSQSAVAESEKIIGSSENNGIKLTINNFAIMKHGQEMMVYYTVQSKSGNLMDAEGTSPIKKPDFFIGDNVVQGIDTEHKKISNQEYQGAVKVKLPQYRPAVSNVAFNTEAIFNQKGQWTINFQIKK